MSLRHERAVGDTQSPFAVQLRRNGAVVNLTGKTVKFLMVDLAGNIVINEENAAVDNALTGDVSYTFTDSQLVANPYYDHDYNHVGFFRVYDGSSKPDTYPAEDEGIQIEIFDPAASRIDPQPDLISAQDIADLARAPMRSRTVEGTIQERPVSELIEAARYLNPIPEKPPWGMRLAKTKPPSTTSS